MDMQTSTTTKTKTISKTKLLVATVALAAAMGLAFLVTTRLNTTIKSSGNTATSTGLVVISPIAIIISIISSVLQN